MKFLIFVLCFGLNAVAKWDGTIYEAKTTTPISLDELSRILVAQDIVVLGENHYTTSVQNAQAQIIMESVSLKGVDWSLGWEFLAHTQKQKTEELWGQVISDAISVAEFLKLTQGAQMSSTYEPILKAVKDLNGSLFGLNLTRAEKSPVVKNGLGALDPSLLPPGFKMLGESYRKRFQVEMGEHVSPELFQNYFEAHCLTDDVMAYQALNNLRGLTFLIAGHFHTDYFDGTVARIRARAPQTKVVNIRVFDASEVKEGELIEQFKNSEYGLLSDYVFFVNEPRK